MPILWLHDDDDRDRRPAWWETAIGYGLLVSWAIWIGYTLITGF